MKKVLIITYYWPPSGGVGVKRWMFFANALVRLGHQVTVVTPKNPQFSLRDENVLKHISRQIEIVKLPIWEPFNVMHQLTGGLNKGQVKQGIVLEKNNRSWVDSLVVWLRGNLFIPDPRVFWVNKTARFLKSFAAQKNIDVLITTGPPHSMHLIGLRIRRKLNVKWIADFRDPWSKWDMLTELKATFLTKAIHRQLEKNVLKNADIVLATSKRQTQMLKMLGAQRAHTINNGFEKLLHLPDPTHSKFRIVHIGLINSLRNPMEFWHVLEEMLLENEEFYQCLEIELYGVVSDQVKHEINKLRNLRDRVQYPGYLTQEDIPEAMQNASVLLVIQNRSSNNRWIIPYKLYEYMPAKRPILQLGGAEGDSNDIILEHQLGLAIDGNNKVALKRALHQLFENWQNKHYTNQSVGIDTFLHENLVKKVAALLD